VRRIVPALALATALASLAPAAAAGAGLRAGAGEADMTPPVGTPMFAYTARSAIADPTQLPFLAQQIVGDPRPGHYATFVPSQGIHTTLRAKALVLARSGERIALVQADLGGLPYALHDAVAERVAPMGISPESIVLTATHTHAGTGPIWPPSDLGYGLLGGDLFDREVFELTADAIAAAIGEAISRLEPARAAAASAELTNATTNRSFEPYLNNPEAPADEEEARLAAIDPTVTVLRVDAAGGTPLAVWSNFAIHPTTFGDENLLFSGDNVAYADRAVEAAIARRARRAGVPAGQAKRFLNVWTNGNEGDISPAREPAVDPAGQPLEYAPSDFARADIAGGRVAGAILAAWERAGSGLRSSLALGARRLFVDFDGSPADGQPVGPVAQLGSGGIVEEAGACFPANPVPGQAPKKPILTGAGTAGEPGLVPRVVPVASLRIGSLGIAALPVEMTQQMWDRIEARLRADAGAKLDRVALAGLANDYNSYTSTPEEYDACDYEGSFTLFGRQQGARYREALRGLQDALLAGEPAPDGAAEPDTVLPPPRTAGAPAATPDAGEVVEQPQADRRRFDRVSFSWRGGDPELDPPRGATFVAIQRQARTSWRTVATEDSVADILELDDEANVWTETLQLDASTRPGTYRFLVRGRAERGGSLARAAAEPYTVRSCTFAVHRLETIAPGKPRVSGKRARVTASYPDPGEDILIALPRRVRSGRATLRVERPGGDAERVVAKPDAGRLAFTAAVPRGSDVRVIEVRDAAGNTSDPTSQPDAADRHAEGGLCPGDRGYSPAASGGRDPDRDPPGEEGGDRGHQGDGDERGDRDREGDPPAGDGQGGEVDTPGGAGEDAGGFLPFTGFAMLALLIMAVGLLVTGVALRRARSGDADEGRGEGRGSDTSL